MSDEDAPVELRIEKGTPVIYQGEDGLEAGTVTQVDGDFVDIGGAHEGHWLRTDDIVATGVFWDQPGIEVVIGD